MRVRLEDRLPATRFGMYPVASMAALTRLSVSTDTRVGLTRARETVMGETPAMRATSRMPARPVPRPLFLPSDKFHRLVDDV
jgi:hypothetical protein